MKDSLSLLDAIHIPFCRPEYQPGNGLTHCNAFVAEVCSTLGFKELDGLLANEIVDKLASHPQWSEVPLDKCQDLANGGTLIVVGIKSDPHGHVCVVCPGKIKSSGRWGNVPTVASIGKVNIIKGMNWAFSEMPKFWCWRNTL